MLCDQILLLLLRFCLGLSSNPWRLFCRQFDQQKRCWGNFKQPFLCGGQKPVEINSGTKTAPQVTHLFEAKEALDDLWSKPSDPSLTPAAAAAVGFPRRC